MKKKALALLLAFVMALSMAVPALAAEDEAASPYAIPADVAGKLVVIHTNDTHGHDVAEEGKTVGTAGVAALKKEFEAAGASVLLLSAGDFSQGTTLVSLDKGASAVEFMNAAGYDAASLGNHEFDYKMDALKANAAKAEFPILAANIVNTETKAPLFGDHTTFDTAIGKVGVFGLDTPETMTKAHPDNVKGLTFYQGEELVACAQAQVDALKADGCVYIIALTHLGVDPESEPNRSEDVFAKVKGVDLVVDGHSHTEMEGEGALTVGGALVVSTGNYLNNVGVVITDGKTTASQLVSAAEYTKVDEAVAAVIDAKDAAVQAEMSKSFGKTEVELNGERAPGNRTEETNLGDFACDAILWQARQNLGEDKVDAALTNGGGIRATIPAGNITMNDMKTVFPFGNTIVTIDVTGAQLLEALEAATCSTPTAIGAFPQVAGITFSIDTSETYAEGDQYPDSTYFAPAAPGSRVTITDVNGKGFDPAATYTIATNDFTAAGGDTYYVFKESKNLTMTAVALEDALIGYTSEVLGGTISAEQYAKPAGRIDVKYVGLEPGAWYVDAAKYVMDEGLMSSTGNGFDPAATVTRATVFQTLYNAEGQPPLEATPAFDDIEGTWYFAAANWAVRAGVATVGEDKLFNGERNITRGEIAAILARYAAYKKLDTTAGGMAIREMADYDTLPEWAVEGMTVCFDNGILSGKPGNLLAANDTAIRAELAAMLLNFSKLSPAKEDLGGYDYTETAVTFDVPETDGIPAHTVPAIVTVPVGAEGQTFPGVVMLHGTGSEKNEAGGGYAIAAPILASQGVASIRFDFMGNGESTADYVNYNYTSAKLDAKAAADYLAGQAAVDGAKLGVMGWSQGGTDAIVAAAAYPDTFKAVVTWSGAVSLDGAGLFGDKTFQEAQAIADKDGYFEMTFDWREPLHLGAQWFKEVKDTDIVKETAKVKAPILAINGLADTTVTPDNAAKIVAASKNDKSFEYLIENCDHTYNVFAEGETGYPTIKKAVNATADYLNGILNDTVLTVPVTVKNGERYVPAVITLPAGKGDFPAVVMNHGHGGSKDENVGFVGVANTLAANGIASIRMDFPGCGESTQPFTENNMTNMISDSNACKDYLVKNAPVNSNKLGILGYSMGGRIALEIANKSGSGYKAVALLSAAAIDADTLAPSIFGSAENYAAAKAEAAKNGSYTLTTQFGQVQELSKKWFDDMDTTNPLTKHSYTGPMLVIHGDQDVVVTPAMNQAILDAYKKAEEVLVAGADHGYGFYSEQPGVTAQVEGTITAFFAENLSKVSHKVTGTVTSPDKYGNLATDILSKDLYAAGFQMGDMLKVKIGSTTFEAPFVGTYSDVAVGAKLVRAPADGVTAIIAINHGDLATEAKAKAGSEITITLAKAAGYLDEYEARNVDRLRTNDRADYASDEVFANFRAITIGDIADGVLYRSSSPVNPELGRNTYADKLAEAAGVKTVVNLADSEEAMEGYEGYADSYYAGLDVIALNMGVDFKSDEFKTKLAEGLKFMTEHEGPYLFHCTEGKDRAGFTAILLEALMGGKLDEIKEDYMLSYVNYYHVEKNTAKYDINAKIAEQMLCQIAGVDEGTDLAKVDLVKAAEDYLTSAGMTAEQIGALKTALSTPVAAEKAA